MGYGDRVEVRSRFIVFENATAGGRVLPSRRGDK